MILGPYCRFTWSNSKVLNFVQKCKAYEKLNETCKKFMVRTIKRFKPADEVRGFFCF